ncbi:tetratricopeptide repeat protein [Spongiimicrobium sp. 3-5]|uniref:tetratricopeptide repeat protein n=1 Tax=Spongiimicrobium sp. 3-5 TaxID=3332596 RepID=UPI00397F9DEF
MNRSQELFEEIERYLKGELSPEAKEAFEERMSKNEELSQEVALHMSVHNEIGNAKELQFRNLLYRIGQEQNINSKRRVFPWRIVASLALLVGASVYFYFQNQDIGGNQLFEEYYTPYPVEDRLRGADLTRRDSVMQLYKVGKFQNAVEDLKFLHEQNPEDADLLLYYGNCLMNLNKEDDAIALFKGVTVKSGGYENSRWYLALSLLKKGNSKAAAKELQQLIDYNGIHKQQAEKLLQKLNL